MERGLSTHKEKDDVEYEERSTQHERNKSEPTLKIALIADSVQTEYCSTFHCSCVRVCVTGVTSHISHIYKGINAMLIIRGPSKPCIF